MKMKFDVACHHTTGTHQQAVATTSTLVFSSSNVAHRTVVSSPEGPPIVPHNFMCKEVNLHLPGMQWFVLHNTQTLATGKLFQIWLYSFESHSLYLLHSFEIILLFDVGEIRLIDRYLVSLATVAA